MDKMLTVFRKCGLVLAIGVLLGMPVIVQADSAQSTTAKKGTTSTIITKGQTANGDQAVIQGYATDTPLQKGMIIQLDPKDSKKVQAVTADNMANTLGVIVAPNDAPVALSSNANTNQVYVSTCCHFPVLVTNQNGPIKTGDYITLSALAGIGMKVDTTQSIVLGKAAAPFTGTSGVIGSVKLKDSTGKEIPVSIGLIPVDISISHNPLQQISEKNVPGFLSQIAQSVAGKSVGASRIYIALAILLIAAFVAGWVLYSGIKGGLIAIGRNPLAKKQIVAGIIRVVLAGLLIFLAGVFGVYLLLKL